MILSILVATALIQCVLTSQDSSSSLSDSNETHENSFKCPQEKPYDCPSTYEPVCGTDAITYNNTCLLCVSADPTIKVKHFGKCNENDCPVRNKNKECFCPFIFKPVCGSNGVTYSNHCIFCCDQNNHKGLKVEHDGSCDESTIP